MAWRFSKRIKLAPGIKLNIGKKGASLSLGKRGATTNVSTRGVRSTVSIPGTGLSYTVGPGSKKSRRKATTEIQQSSQTADAGGTPNAVGLTLVLLVVAAIVVIGAFWSFGR